MKTAWALILVMLVAVTWMADNPRGQPPENPPLDGTYWVEGDFLKPHHFRFIMFPAAMYESVKDVAPFSDPLYTSDSLFIQLKVQGRGLTEAECDTLLARGVPPTGFVTGKGYTKKLDDVRHGRIQ